MAEILKALAQLLSNPGAFKLLAVCMATVLTYFIFSAWVGSLAMPATTSSDRYKFWFRFLNRLAGNLSRAASALLHIKEREGCGCGEHSTAVTPATPATPPPGDIS